MASLADVNLLFAIVNEEHEHANLARTWLTGQTEEGSVGLLRLLTSRAAMGARVSTPRRAWDYWDELLSDGRFAFIDEPQGLEEEWQGLSNGLQRGASLNTDTYLAAFAIAGGYAFATFDGGCARFPRLSVDILAAAA